MARPQKTSEPLTEPFSFRLTKSEGAELRAKITASNLPRAEFLRDCVLKNKTVVVAKPKASLQKSRMQFLFNKTSNNMNQIAHVLNSANLAGTVSNPLCEKTVASLEAIARYLKTALNHVD